MIKPCVTLSSKPVRVSVSELARVSVGMRELEVLRYLCGEKYTKGKKRKKKRDVSFDGAT